MKYWVFFICFLLFCNIDLFGSRYPCYFIKNDSRYLVKILAILPKENDTQDTIFIDTISAYSEKTLFCNDSFLYSEMKDYYFHISINYRYQKAGSSIFSYKYMLIHTPLLFISLKCQQIDTIVIRGDDIDSIRQLSYDRLKSSENISNILRHINKAYLVQDSIERLGYETTANRMNVVFKHYDTVRLEEKIIQQRYYDRYALSSLIYGYSSYSVEELNSILIQYPLSERQIDTYKVLIQEAIKCSRFA